MNDIKAGKVYKGKVSFTIFIAKEYSHECRIHSCTQYNTCNHAVWKALNTRYWKDANICLGCYNLFKEVKGEEDE